MSNEETDSGALDSSPLLAAEAAAFLRERGFFSGIQVPHHCGEDVSSHGWTKVAELMAGFAEQAIAANADLSGGEAVRSK
jgi:hypothetical protein